MLRAVLEKDPAFGAVLDQHDAIERQVDALRGQLETARTTADQHIRSIQRRFREQRLQLERQVQGLLEPLESQRQQLQLAAQTLQHQMRAQQATIQSLRKTIAALERSVQLERQAPTPPAAAEAAIPADHRTSLPPTGEATSASQSRGERLVLTRQLSATQHELQQAQDALDQQRTRLNILRYKLRLVRIH